MIYVIAEPCIGEKNASCVDVCPVDCIYEDQAMFIINPSECIGCGVCEPACPVEAIFPEASLPVHWVNYAAQSREFEFPRDDSRR